MTKLASIPLPYESKKENRFLLEFPSSFNIEQWVVSASTRPELFFYAGILQPRPITINFYDPIGPSTSQRLMLLYEAQNDLKAENKIDELQKTALHKDMEGGFNYEISMLDPTGRVVEKWKVKGCVITEMNFGTLDSTSYKLASCSITVKPSELQLIF